MGGKTVESVEKIINKGIPVDAPVSLLASDILNLCSKSEELKDSLDKGLANLIEFLKSKVEYYPDVEIFQTLNIIQDGDSVNKQLCFSKEAICSTIFYSLNMSLSSGEVGDFFTESSDFREKIALLRKVYTDKKLAREFPVLYQSYVRAFEFKKIAQRMKSSIGMIVLTNNNRVKLEETVKKSSGSTMSLDDIFSMADEELNPKKYANACADLFMYIVDNFSEVINFLHQNPIELTALSKEEFSKFELYVAHKYLECAEMFDGSLKQKYLYYVSNYFYELGDDINSDLEVTVGKYKSIFDSIPDQEGYIVTQKTLLDRYKKLLISNPELKTVTLKSVDFSTMTPSEVEEFMSSYLNDLSANWELIPDSRGLDEAFTVNVSKRTIGMSEEEKEKYREHLMNIYLEKKSFHESQDPFCTLQGLGTFDGYIAYVHSNGCVVLEKYFDNVNTGRVSMGDAIYIMDFSDFHRLSQLTKRELIDSKQCKRVIHRGNWQSRVLEEIKSSSSKSDVSESYKSLVKTGSIDGFGSSNGSK